MNLHDIPVTTIDGRQTTMGEFKGRTLLVVNVASQCGFTPQYRGLEHLWRELRDRGLTVIGFPCDQFGHQEPGTEAEIAQFCERRYDVTFPMMAKIEVNGDGAHALYQLLKREKPGLLGTEAIKWNFTKFLVGPDGTVEKRYAPNETPEEIGRELAKRLGT
ncbi:MAG: glutathione peroxidase [Gemmatimonadetes bacterium]|jgi:glutathione peroxidase|nr:glutathione peroxidase [Gemmatimonadota bacterium]